MGAADGLRWATTVIPANLDRPPDPHAAAQQQELVHQLKRGALAAGFSTDRWTLQRIQQLIRQKFKVTYHPNYLSRLLRKLGWTPQYPLPRAKEHDDELVEAWLRQDWPRIKKGASNWRRNRVV